VIGIPLLVMLFAVGAAILPILLIGAIAAIVLVPLVFVGKTIF
jgi:hypothetical protein